MIVNDQVKERPMSDTQNRSLSRGLDILERLSDEPGGLELHEIARVLSMPKSSAFNLVHTLVDKKYLPIPRGTRSPCACLKSARAR